MADFIWLDQSRFINLNQLAYIEFDEAVARVAFANGDKLLVEGEDTTVLRKYLERICKQSVASLSENTAGFKPGPRFK
jgi:hypothetical protein